MPKGYIVANIRARDMDAMGRFAAASGPVIAEFGGRVLVRDPAPEQREGNLQGTIVIVEFDDVATAKRFYESPGYQAAISIRDAVAETDLRIAEGV